MPTLGSIIYSQLFITPPYPEGDLTGQTVIITGSNTGIGLEAAFHLRRLNVERLILAVRTVDKGLEAKRSIEERYPRKGVIEVWGLDLTSYDSVKEFVQRASKLRRVDCVIQNAAVGSRNYTELNGNETTITVNVISTFLFAILLLPVLRKTARNFNIQPRLCIVASDVHGMTAFPECHQQDIFQALNADKSTMGMSRRYGVTKILGVLFTRELAARAGKPDETGVIINCLNPGFTLSELNRDAPFYVRPIIFLLNMTLARTTEVGSRAHLHAATSSSVTHGQYLSDGQIEPPSAFVLSHDGAETQHRGFDQLLSKLEEINPGISQLVTKTQ
ncbi:MAG: hypothetical protein M1827_005136 [Pycnora praestabilis]|nr:MAG: hypothetical protein M1827_005136 [Pycnora praestabilis]